MNKYKFFLLGIILFFVVTSYLTLNDLFIYTPDSARYIAWAQSLAQGKGYTDYTEAEAFRYCIHSPMYSLLLAPIAYLFPNDIIALKTVNILLASGIIVFLFTLIYQKSSPIAAVIATLVLVINPWIYFLSTQILSEVLFGFGFIILLYVMNKEFQGQTSRRNFLTVCVALVVCIFSREVGILLFPVLFGFYILLKRYNRAIVIFFLAIVLYAGWYIRNEIYYAGVDLPPLKNSALFFSNTLVSMESSFFQELWFRILNNGLYYFKQAITIVFTTSYNVFPESTYAPWISLIDIQHSAMQLLNMIVHKIHWLVSSISIALIAIGMILEYRDGKIFYLKIIFLLMYIFVLLVYPVFDARFLFPVLLLMLLWFGYAVNKIFQVSNRTVQIVFVTTILLLSIPNIVWSFNFIVTQHRLINDPAGSFIEKEYPNRRTSHSQITLPVAARWINEQNDPSTVVLTPYKELNFYLKNKKVRVINGFFPVNFFNQIIRDYEIRYLVLMRDIYGWRDCEYQLGLNEKYSFQLVHTAGCFEVYEIVPKKIDTVRFGFGAVLQKIAKGEYVAADSFFNKNRIVMTNHPNLTLLSMINKHLLGQLDSAEILMRRLYLMPQGLMYSKLASLHQTTIDRRRQLETQNSPAARADILMTLGLNYWELGFRKLAQQYARQCIQTDSNYALAYAYNIIYDLQCGDTSVAYSVHKKLQRNFPNTEFTSKIDSLMNSYTSYRSSVSLKEKAVHLEKVTEHYMSLRLDDMAIDCAYETLQCDPQRISVYKKLAEVYERQRRFYPALLTLQRYQKVASSSEGIEGMMSSIQGKLYLD